MELNIIFNIIGVQTVAANGFMNGTGEESLGKEDVYPDGPLQSGTDSLKRIKKKSKVIISYKHLPQRI